MKALPECLEAIRGVMFKACNVTWDPKFICIPGDLGLTLCQQERLDLSIHNILTAVALPL